MAPTCLECGVGVPVKAATKHGTQPRFCSLVCRKAYRKTYCQRWEAANRETQLVKRAAYMKAYNAKNPDYFKKHYAKNRDKRKRQANEWYHANTEKALETQRMYAAKHPEQIRQHGRKAANKRRAIKKRVFVEVVDPQAVYVRDKGTCGICKRAVRHDSKWHIDHIMPISKGGAHSYDNVQLAHGKCNRMKSAALPKGQPTLFQVATWR